MKTKRSFLSVQTICGYGILLPALLISGCAPYISAVNPGTGYPGNPVNINGGRFGATTAENTVQFGNVIVPASDVTVISTGSLQTIVPAGAQTGLVSVKTSKGIGYSKTNFVVPSKREWTFMVYLDADNNLEDAGLEDFMEMSSVRSIEKVTVLVQMDRINGYSADYGDWQDTRRFMVREGDTPLSAPVANLGEQNMGDPNVLSDFVEWGITNYPAEHYALVIWNHGDGWRKSFEKMMEISGLKRGGTDEVPAKAIASDDTDNDVLYMKEVKDALVSARLKLTERNITKVKIDLIGFDACLMGMVEVAYELRDLTNYMVGSEELEPNDGWPYEEILSDLVSSPTISPENFARRIVINYGNSYSSSITMAAYDMNQINVLATRIDEFANKATSEWSTLKTARANARDYHPPGYYTIWSTDLYDFASRTYNTVTSADIKTAANEVMKAIDAMVIEERHSLNEAGSHGMAIYFPPDVTAYNNDPQHTGYQDGNTFMPVDYVGDHSWDTWLRTFYANIP